MCVCMKIIKVMYVYFHYLLHGYPEILIIINIVYSIRGLFLENV